jgi:DNA invertase Pin-like site-specific DNA recombinase
MGVCAEFERAMIRERVQAGLQRALAEGKSWAAPSNPSDRIDGANSDRWTTQTSWSSGHRPHDKF